MLNSNIIRVWGSIIIITDTSDHHNLLCPFSSRTGGKPIPLQSKLRALLRRIYYMSHEITYTCSSTLMPIIYQLQNRSTAKLFLKGICRRFTQGVRPETTKLSPFNATMFDLNPLIL